MTCIFLSIVFDYTVIFIWWHQKLFLRKGCTKKVVRLII